MRRMASAIIAATLFCATAARADDLIRRGGEWHTTVTGIGPEPQTMDLCFSQTSMTEAMAKMAAGHQCSKRDITITGQHMTLDIVCGGMAIQGTADFTGDDAYTSDLTMHMGAGAGARTMHALSTAKWIGACKPGEKPMN
jgi:hypothetical protein